MSAIYYLVLQVMWIIDNFVKKPIIRNSSRSVQCFHRYSIKCSESVSFSFSVRRPKREDDKALQRLR